MDDVLASLTDEQEGNGRPEEDSSDEEVPHTPDITTDVATSHQPEVDDDNDRLMASDSEGPSNNAMSDNEGEDGEKEKDDDDDEDNDADSTAEELKPQPPHSKKKKDDDSSSSEDDDEDDEDKKMEQLEKTMLKTKRGKKSYHCGHRCKNKAACEAKSHECCRDTAKLDAWYARKGIVVNTDGVKSAIPVTKEPKKLLQIESSSDEGEKVQKKSSESATLEKLPKEPVVQGTK
jgi:hypothetical protein